MTIYVDSISKYPIAAISQSARKHGQHWSHLIADSTEELHDIASMIGLKRSYFQHEAGKLPHYDVTPAMRERTITLGAVHLEGREWIKKVSEIRKKYAPRRNMSIKTYTAWKFPYARLQEANRDLTKLILENAYPKFKAVAHLISRTPDKETGVVLAFDNVLEITYKTREWLTASPMNKLRSMSSGFSLYFDKKYVYAVPYGNYATGSFIPDWFEDFHYQNQTDIPSNITRRDWNKRSKKWKELFEQSPGNIILEIIGNSQDDAGLLALSAMFEQDDDSKILLGEK